MSKHLIGAVRDFVLAQTYSPALSGAVDGQAGRDQPLPYLVLSVKDLRSLRIMGGSEVQWIRLEFAVFAKTRVDAETLGNAIRDAILPPDDSPTWTPLALSDSWIDVNRQPAGGDSIEIDPEERAALGVDVWCCRRPISWTISRG